MKFQKGSIPKNKLTHEEWYQKNIEKLENRNIKLLTKYEKSNTKIKILFEDCGHMSEMLPGNIVKGYGCKHCSGNQKRTHKMFLNDFYKCEDSEEYEVLGAYNNSNEKIKIKHKCSFEYEVRPSKFINSNKRCPKCNFSKGEKHIYNFLKKNNVDFKEQFRFDDCRLKNKLPFDFALFENDELLCLIEYQGEQHFRARDFFGGEEGFIYQQKRDSIKKEYCIKNNIPLIEIPYWEKSPSVRLLKEMEKQGITHSLNTIEK